MLSYRAACEAIVERSMRDTFEGLLLPVPPQSVEISASPMRCRSSNRLSKSAAARFKLSRPLCDLMAGGARASPAFS